MFSLCKVQTLFSTVTQLGAIQPVRFACAHCCQALGYTVTDENIRASFRDEIKSHKNWNVRFLVKRPPISIQHHRSGMMGIFPHVHLKWFIHSQCQRTTGFIKFLHGNDILGGVVPRHRLLEVRLQPFHNIEKLMSGFIPAGYVFARLWRKLQTL